MTEVTPLCTSAMVREPTTIHTGDDSSSSIDHHQIATNSLKMPDLSESQLRMTNRAATTNNRSPVSQPPQSQMQSSGDEGPHEDEDKHLDSTEEVGNCL